jgi:hypothetical protein
VQDNTKGKTEILFYETSGDGETKPIDNMLSEEKTNEH